MKSKIYFDYAASTPVDPRVFEAMQPYFTEKFGNPGSVHAFGQEAIAGVDHARETIAKSIGADFRQVIFTSSASEANGLALHGALARAREQKFGGDRPRIIISSIEHESIMESARAAERNGVDVVYLPVNDEGFVTARAVKENLNERTVLVSVLYANNEVGTIQPIGEIAGIVKDFRGKNNYPLVHTDAAQAIQFLDCDVRKLGVDLMTFSSQKIYGPKGAGALYIHDHDALMPLVYGGGQEFGLRSGTENVPAIVGFGKSVELVVAARDAESKRITGLREQLWQGIKKTFPQAELNNSLTDNSLPNILNVFFPGHEAQDILTKFDLHGLAASSGSACRSRALEASYVILAMGYGEDRARSSIRFSLGRPTTQEEIKGSLAIIDETFSRKYS